jgi:hypothetical protein
MAKDYTNGIPQDMREAASQIEMLDCDAVNWRPAAADEGGLAECARLSGADTASTVRVQELFTQVRQGFAGFQAIIVECADYYANAAGMSREELDTVVNRPADPGLPDREPQFQNPRGVVA